MTEILKQRRNGKFTCLDCMRLKTKECGPCVSKNWELFSLDQTVLNMSYAEKSERYENLAKHNN
jgi:hypothetical protein